jgi:UDP-N-acetylglucosamine 2-epimerase (non-hydrolysing)
VKIASVVGARPNFIKLAPVYRETSTFADHIVIHTGQHYDFELSEVFFKEFSLPKPDYNLGVGSGRPSYQIGEMIKRLEEIFLKIRPDLVVVYGDTNSTFDGALSANRMDTKVAHVESGLRSFDRRMPEETNRVLTDQMSEYLFAPTRTAVKDLEREHVYGKVVHTDDVSVELVKNAVGFAANSSILTDTGLEPKSYILCTMHRAENTASKESLISVIRAFKQLSKIKIVFPIHPRTLRMMKEANLLGELRKCKNVKIIKQIGHIDFIRLIKDASKVITDSGGVQREAYLLCVPCITIRKNTEWVETVKAGWNILTDTVTEKIVRAARSWEPRGRTKPIFGDGTASAKMGKFIKRNLAT